MKDHHTGDSVKSKHTGDTITLPDHTIAMADFESGLRAHWGLQSVLIRISLIKDKETIKLGIGLKARHPDPDMLAITATGKTFAELDGMSKEEILGLMSSTARMKSPYWNPAEGPIHQRQALIGRYERRFGVKGLQLEQVLFAAGGCSQGLDNVIGNLFDRNGVVPVDVPCWPGLPPKLVRHGVKPVGMLRCHVSFDANRHHLAPLIDRGIAGVYVAFPGNPIGLRLTPERLDVLTRTRLWLRDRCIDAGKRPPIWISDGVYLDQPASTLSLLAGEDPAEVVELYALTKGRLAAGHRDHYEVVGRSSALIRYVAQQARDGLSGNVGWHYPDAHAYLIDDSHGFLSRERELDAAAGLAFDLAIKDVPGLSIDEAVDDQYRYVHCQFPEDGPDSEDWKRWSMLNCAANGTTWVDWVPGVYFNHPVLMREMGIRNHEVDGIRTIMAYAPEIMDRAGRLIAESWRDWCESGFLVVPGWDDCILLLENGVTPQQILAGSADGSIEGLIDGIKAKSASA